MALRSRASASSYSARPAAYASSPARVPAAARSRTSRSRRKAASEAAKTSGAAVIDLIAHAVARREGVPGGALPFDGLHALVPAQTAKGISCLGQTGEVFAVENLPRAESPFVLLAAPAAAVEQRGGHSRDQGTHHGAGQR